MTASYTPSLRLPLMTPGDASVRNAWGTILNNALQCIEAAITGNAEISLASLTSYTLTVANDATDQARLGFYNFTGALTGACTVTMPAVAKTGWAQNNTTGGFDIVLTTGTGATVTLSPGQTVSYQTFGSDVFVPSLGNAVPGAGRLVGEVVDFAGYSAPALWYLCYGQAFSRTTYAALFTALTFTTTGNITNGSNQITNVAGAPPNAGFYAVALEGPGIPTGSTITASSGTTLTISKNATATSTGSTIRFLPHGQGDGSTTFNLPDRRARQSAGNDYMGGTPSGRITSASGIAEAHLGATGGNQLAQAHAHTINDPGHAHGVSDPGHAHSVSDPTHNHNPSTHLHGISDPGHAHGISDPGHVHFLPFSNASGGAGGTVLQPSGFNPQYGTSGSTTRIGIYAATTGVNVQYSSNFISNAATGIGIYGAYTGVGIQASGTGVSVNSALSGNSQNIAPVLFLNTIIYAGV